jgi:hypothetical protein
MKNINILKRNCHVGINVVFLEMILKLYDVWFMKNIFIYLLKGMNYLKTNVTYFGVE